MHLRHDVFVVVISARKERMEFYLFSPIEHWRAWIFNYREKKNKNKNHNNFLWMSSISSIPSPIRTHALYGYNEWEFCARVASCRHTSHIVNGEKIANVTAITQRIPNKKLLVCLRHRQWITQSLCCRATKGDCFFYFSLSIWMEIVTFFARVRKVQSCVIYEYNISCSYTFFPSSTDITYWFRGLLTNY